MFEVIKCFRYLDWYYIYVWDENLYMLFGFLLRFWFGCVLI